MEREITVPVKLDAKTFRRFSFFDTFVLRKRWIRPAAFAAILFAFAAVALISRKPQSGLIAAVLLVVGLGLPLVYVGTFLSQVNLQAAKLDPPRRVYTVGLTFDGVRVANDQRKEDAQFVKWADVPAAFRRKGCVYLYVAPARAYLIPDGQANTDDEAVWSYLHEHMGERCKG
ncbi:MAG: hypothetical protein IJ646_02845 [Clostridia bacterium]|nr:hypothetical protein [Clostridia bacterium]